MEQKGAAGHSNGAATIREQKGGSGDGHQERKKRTATKNRGSKDELMSEQKVDKYIAIRQQIEAAGHEIEDEEFDLNDSANFEACVDRLKMWDQCLDNAVRLEQRLLPHVLFDDVEDAAQQNDLIDVIQQVAPVLITNSGLEPLNSKLTEFINNPLHYYVDNNSDNATALPRAVTSINHIAPSFDQIKQMVEEIRAKGDCPLVDLLAPADNPTEYDAFVCKVLADLLDILKRQRFDTNLELIERDARTREHQQQQQDEQQHNATSGGGAEDQPMAGPSSSYEQHTTTAADTHATSTHEKFLEAIQKGEIQTEGEDAVADGEDLGDGEEDEWNSEAGSDDYTESTYSSATDTAVVGSDAAALQQHNQQQEQGDDKTSGDVMDVDDDGGHTSAAAAEPTAPENLAQQLQSEAVAPPSSESNNVLACISDDRPSSSSTTQFNNSNNKTAPESPAISASTPVVVALSSSEKVRLQKHQLNKLFSSAARLRSPPLLPPPSLSVIKTEIVDLTLDENDEDDDCTAISDCTNDCVDVSAVCPDAMGPLISDESSSLEIIDEIGGDGKKNWEEDELETVSSTSIPSEVHEAAKAMNLNGSAGRKRKSEDEEESETAEASGKRLKRDDDCDNDDDDDIDDEEEEEEDSTDVVEDSEEGEGNINGRVISQETMKNEKTEEETSATTSSDDDDDDEDEVQMGERSTGNAAGDQPPHQQQLMDLDDDSIICLSDG